MNERERLIGAMASVKPKAERRMRDAVREIIRAVWDHRSADFSLDGLPEVDAEVNAILRAMSDGNIRDAETAALGLLELLDMEEWSEEAVEHAERERDGQNALFRLDMHASHLKELLVGWVAVAAAAGLTAAALESEIWKHIGNPFASELWRKSGAAPPSWGKGYARDIVSGTAVVEQDIVNSAYQYAKVMEFGKLGAVGYRTERNSTFDCPFCDEMSGKVWPLDEIVLPYHPRCVCIPVPVYENEI